MISAVYTYPTSCIYFHFYHNICIYFHFYPSSCKYLILLPKQQYIFSHLPKQLYAFSLLHKQLYIFLLLPKQLYILTILSKQLYIFQLLPKQMYIFSLFSSKSLTDSTTKLIATLHLPWQPEVCVSADHKPAGHGIHCVSFLTCCRGSVQARLSTSNVPLSSNTYARAAIVIHVMEQTYKVQILKFKVHLDY